MTDEPTAKDDERATVIHVKEAGKYGWEEDESVNSHLEGDSCLICDSSPCNCTQCGCTASYWCEDEGCRCCTDCATGLLPKFT